MIYLYSGVPGSGKSYHAAVDIYEFAIKKKLYVITNLPIDYEKLCKHTKITPSEARQRVFIKDNNEITIDYLKMFSRRYLPRGKENQCLLVFDEAGDKFNARSFADDDRMDWLKFFRVHRHYGYKILLVCQHDRYLDRQIRGCIQTEVEHRSFKYYKTFGFLLYYLFGGLFQTVSYNYPLKSQSRSTARVGHKILKLRKKYANIYNTFQCFDDDDMTLSSGCGVAVFNAAGDLQTDQQPEDKAI